MSRPKAAFNIGDYVRMQGLGDVPHVNTTGIVRDAEYGQHVDKITGDLVDVWSWVYLIEFVAGDPVWVMGCFLRKARVDE